MFAKRFFVIVFVLCLGIIFVMGGCDFPFLTPTTYSITSTAGTGGQINPEGELAINEGENQTFTITPDEGYEIGDVLVDDASEGPIATYTFQNVQQNHIIQASFVQQTQPPAPTPPTFYTYYTITATAGAGGGIQPVGIIKVIKGTNRTFTIIPLAGYQINDVLVDSASVGAVPTYTFQNVQQNHTIQANFVLIPVNTFTLTMEVIGEGDTTPVVGTYTYTAGTVVDITATPLGECCLFTEWSGDVTGTVNPTTVTMDADKTVTANFAPRKVYNDDTGSNYDTIQEAIDAATDGDTIIVCPGTYEENIEFDGRNITVQSANPLDPDTTIIDGGGIGSVVRFVGADTSILQGFTIQNGSANQGAGIYVDSSDSTITGNTITGNTITGNSSTGPSPEYNGAGIYVHNSSPTITGNTITGNTITGNTDDELDNNGAGIYVNNSSPTITGNFIQNNSATHLGGGIYMNESFGNITGNEITDNGSTDNTMGNGSGIAVVYYSDPTITGNTITGNTAANSGGGIYVNWYSDPTITGNNVITGNTANNGGGIVVRANSDPTITGNTITGNTAENDGGGVYVVDSTPSITGNTIGGLLTGNTAANNGGGVFVYNSSPTIESNDITDNTAYLYGGGIYVSLTSNLLPATDRPTGWGTGRENIPNGDPLVPAEGVVYTIAGNDFVGNTHNPSDYSGGAHVFFDL